MPALETAPPDAGRRRVARFSLITLGYTLLVILFGAVVRITGSGAGCGQHWPTCHGEVAHLPSSVETMIELTHRVTSGLSLLLVVGVAVLCFRVSAPRDPLRKYALASVGFMLLEAAIGAVLVLLELVGRNDSFARAVVMSLHLVNTCLLTGSLTLLALAARDARTELRWSLRLALAFAGVLLISVTGAVTALGDTIYPVASAAPQVPTHFLVEVRALHPLTAVVVSVYLLALAGRSLNAPLAAARSWARLLIVAVVAQMAIGVINILLSAPGYLQVIHLAAANALWLVLVVLGTHPLEQAVPEQQPATA